ncbi:nucleoside deaminase [Frankia sp. AiPs1]|uniref:nucleoside deaminase n=1 Tax=Frankia sp. AiPs1 TaxID=573493 RepID=UPI002043DEE0|nr:nucleoside deaminase [Frankia sp. AiPs1]MCM3920471.1 nucleoside deaminase [Frankia sp. AiPs1]
MSASPTDPATPLAPRLDASRLDAPCLDASRPVAALGVTLPAWVDDEVDAVGTVLPDVEQRMDLVHRLAARNHREGCGGPFAAVVADPDTGEIYAAGVNLVLASGLSAMHAEVVALSFAQARLGRWDLSAVGTPVELVVNWRPCVMCYGAVMWSGVQLLTIAGVGDEVEQLTGFDEGPMRDDWQEQFARRGITVRTDILRDQALKVFADYGRRDDVVVYNARRGAAPTT